MNDKRMETVAAGGQDEPVQMNMIQAINSAMDVMMARDPNVIVMGEDVGYFGGVFRATAGEIEICLPRRATLRDLLTGEVHRDVDRIKAALPTCFAVFEYCD